MKNITNFSKFSSLVSFNLCKFSTRSSFNPKQFAKTLEIPKELSYEMEKKFEVYNTSNIHIPPKDSYISKLGGEIKNYCANTEFLETIERFKEDPNFIILNLLGAPFNKNAVFNDIKEHAVSIYFISAIANIIGYERHYDDDKLPNPYIVQDSGDYFSGLPPHNDRTGMGVDLVSLTSVNPSNTPTSFIPTELIYDKLSEKDKEILSHKIFYLTGLQGNEEKTFPIISFDSNQNLKIEYRSDGTINFKKDALNNINDDEIKSAMQNLDTIVYALSYDKNSKIDICYDKFSTVIFKNMIHFKEETVNNSLRVLIRNLYKDKLPKNTLEEITNSKQLVDKEQNIFNNNSLKI